MEQGRRLMPEATTVQVKFPYTRSHRDRHGKLRVEYRRQGKIIPLRAQAGTAEFQAEYDRAQVSFEQQETEKDQRLPRKPKAGTFRWLCVEYFRSVDFEQLAASTQRTRKQMLEAMLDEPIFVGAEYKFADCPIARL